MHEFVMLRAGERGFGLETEGEATRESENMCHAVERYYRREREKAAQTFRPRSDGLLRAGDWSQGPHPARNAAIPDVARRERRGSRHRHAAPRGREDRSFRTIIVGRDNGDPYLQYGDAIRALGRHFGTSLERARCYPYRRD